jgi:hypothetical protein
MSDICVDDLREVHENRKKAQRDIYKKIYVLVCQKINKINRLYYIKKCTYYVPVMMWGLPLYRMEDCLIYTRWRLKKKGIQTRFTYPNLLEISWEKAVDTDMTIEGIAEKDEEKSKENEYVEPIRWDQKIISEKNEQTLEEQKYRDDLRRHRRRHKKDQHEEKEIERDQRHRQEEIEDIIHHKNQQALLALEYGFDTHKPKTKVLQIT